MHFNDVNEVKSKLFIETNTESELRMPMHMSIADIPKIHHYEDQVGKDFLKQLSCSDSMDTLYQRVYIQSMLEHKWPPIKQAIINRLLIPYMIYLGLFSTYCLNLREIKREMLEGDKIYTTFFYAVQAIILFITMYFIKIECVQFFNTRNKYFSSIWNYIDIIPMFLVVSSLAVSTFSQKEFL